MKAAALIAIYFVMSLLTGVNFGLWQDSISAGGFMYCVMFTLSLWWVDR